MSAIPNQIVGIISDQINDFARNGLPVDRPLTIAKPSTESEDNSKAPAFPIDIFLPGIKEFISHQSIQKEYLAGAILGAVSTAIGNSANLQAMSGYNIKAIVYLVIVAPPGASKSPSLKIAFDPIEYHDGMSYENYQSQMEVYKELTSGDKENKSEKPQKPNFPQTLIKDSTIEMVVKILSCNPSGCCLLADELSGWVKRMNQYKAGDEQQKWLELWSGSAILLQRITRDENKVQNPFCTIVGGIQPGVLESLSKGENEHNGFFHRFLFVYPEPQKKVEWKKLDIPFNVLEGYRYIFRALLKLREDPPVTYYLSDEANSIYGKWFNAQNFKYNSATDDNVKGVIAKYQDYCLRFSLIIQVLNDGSNREGVVSTESMQSAIRLTEYFLYNMNKALKLLNPETPIDSLNTLHGNLYKTLPELFTTKIAIGEGQKLEMKDSAIKMFLARAVEKKLITQIKRGEYEKNY